VAPGEQQTRVGVGAVEGESLERRAGQVEVPGEHRGPGQSRAQVHPVGGRVAGREGFAVGLDRGGVGAGEQQVAAEGEESGQVRAGRDRADVVEQGECVLVGPQRGLGLGGGEQPRHGGGAVAREHEVAPDPHRGAAEVTQRTSSCPVQHRTALRWQSVEQGLPHEGVPEGEARRATGQQAGRDGGGEDIEDVDDTIDRRGELVGVEGRPEHGARGKRVRDVRVEPGGKQRGTEIGPGICGHPPGRLHNRVRQPARRRPHRVRRRVVEVRRIAPR
jgi:hypothetical protein